MTNAVVGADSDEHVSGVRPGSAYVFVRSSEVWIEEAKLTASDGASGDYFGCSVALNGDTAVVGAKFDDHAGRSDAGSAYMFHFGCDTDTDGDGVPDGMDNCPSIGDSGQEDADQDGPGDSCDNCPGTSNPGQEDIDEDGQGDPCDPCPAAPLDECITLDCAYTITPLSGTVPFVTHHTVTLTNLYLGLSRRMALRINVRLANGTSYSNWRSGYNNSAPGANYVRQWNQTIPALGSVIGNNVFILLERDVTPSPYNQPPYPPSGDTCSVTNTVVASAP